MPPVPPPQTGGSLADLLTTAQNLVQAVNNAATTYLQVQGKQSAVALAATTLVRAGAGRVCSVSVTTAGAAGHIYDSINTAATVAPIYTVPAVLGVYVVNLPVSFGIVYVPGASQVATISFS